MSTNSSMESKPCAAKMGTNAGNPTAVSHYATASWDVLIGASAAVTGAYVGVSDGAVVYELDAAAVGYGNSHCYCVLR